MTYSTLAHLELSPSKAASHSVNDGTQASRTLSRAAPSPTTLLQFHLPAAHSQQLVASRKTGQPPKVCSPKYVSRQFVRMWKRLSRHTRRLGIIPGFGSSSSSSNSGGGAEQRASRLLPDGFILVTTAHAAAAAQRHNASLRRSIVAP